MSSSAGCSTRPRSPRWRPVSAAAVRTISRVRWRSWPRANGCRLSCAGAPRAPCHLPDILLMCDHDNARRTSKSLMCMLVKGVCVSVGVAARRTSSALTAWHVQVLLLWQLLLGGGGRSGRRAVAAPATRCADKCTPPCRYTNLETASCPRLSNRLTASAVGTMCRCGPPAAAAGWRSACWSAARIHRAPLGDCGIRPGDGRRSQRHPV